MLVECEHNHPWPWIDATDNSLYHPDCDPRKLCSTCPACKELMIAWKHAVDTMLRENR